MLTEIPNMDLRRFDMNAYYNKNGYYNSNTDIFEEYFYGHAKAVPAWQKNLDLLLSYLCAIVTALCSVTAKRLYRDFGVALSLVGIIGVIGAMESNILPIWVGILVALPLLGFEFLCLRRR